LDGVRGTAILLVVLHHAAQFSPDPAAQPLVRLLNHALQAGWLGVDVFFVLSGFLITGVLLDARGSGPRPPDGFFRSFYARRALRILPLYYLAVGAILVLHPVATPRGTWWLWLFLVNIVIARANDWNAGPPATAHLWSLAVEEQFYLVWPVLIAWLPARAFRLVTYGLVIVAPIVRAVLVSHGHGIAAHVLTSARADALALGACAAFAVRERRRSIEIAQFIAGAAVIGLLYMLTRDQLIDQAGATALLGGLECATVLTAAVIYLAVAAPGSFRWLSNPVLTSLGKYSYAMYLIHLPMRHTIATWVGDHVSGALPMLMCNIVLLLGLSWIGAWILWRVIERPALSLKRYFPMPTPVGAPVVEPAAGTLTNA
jgi:peptidoglycan/LPS O-acetylase OafA/YrhL